MSLYFSPGNLELLKSKLKSLIQPELWQEINDNTFRARLLNGAVISYYVTTGTIQFQGRLAPQRELESKVTAILNQGENVIEENTRFGGVMSNGEGDDNSDANVNNAPVEDAIHDSESSNEISEGKMLSDEFSGDEIVIAFDRCSWGRVQACCRNAC